MSSSKQPEDKEPTSASELGVFSKRNKALDLDQAIVDELKQLLDKSGLESPGL